MKGNTWKSVLTVNIIHEVWERILSWKDVDLPSQRIAERMLPSADHVVKHAACREHVHCWGLWRFGEKNKWEYQKKLNKHKQKHTCVQFYLQVYSLVYLWVLQELSNPQFLVFQSVKKSCSGHLGSSYRGQSQRWELGLDPERLDQTGECFWASGHDGLHQERDGRTWISSQKRVSMEATNGQISTWIHFRPMLRECRWERPHMVCSSSVIWSSSGKQEESSTYCREYTHTPSATGLKDAESALLTIVQHWPVAGLLHKAQWQCMWRGGPSLCRNIWWHSDACRILGGAAPLAQPPQNSLAGFS